MFWETNSRAIRTVYPSDIEYKDSFEKGLHEVPHTICKSRNLCVWVYA